jgi:hypothetical protein
MSAEDNNNQDKLIQYLEMIFDFLEASAKLDQSPKQVS